MAAYVMASVDVQDAAVLEEDRRPVPATVARHGGRFLALVDGV